MRRVLTETETGSGIRDSVGEPGLVLKFLDERGGHGGLVDLTHKGGVANVIRELVSGGFEGGIQLEAQEAAVRLTAVADPDVLPCLPVGPLVVLPG